MTGADAGADDRDEQPEQMTGTDDRGGCRGAAGGTEIFYRPAAPPLARCTTARNGLLRPFPGRRHRQPRVSVRPVDAIFSAGCFRISFFLLSFGKQTSGQRPVRTPRERCKTMVATLRKIFRFYYDGFRAMTLGRTLWAIILIKLFIMFAILKVFFFPDLLAGKSPEERSSYVLEQLTPEN